MRRRYEPARESVPNLAPMVDVIMVLLVFFLLGTSLELVKQGILQTELDPSSGPGAGAKIEINPRIRIALADLRGGEGATIYLLDEWIGDNDFDKLYRVLLDRRTLEKRMKTFVSRGPELDAEQVRIALEREG